MVVFICTVLRADVMLDDTKHAELMNDTYRTQRLFYDATRKYYLFGRDYLIKNLDAPKNARILEVACGTGRNLAMVARHYPNAKLYGLDISSQMLVSADAKLKDRAMLAEADACDFDPVALFGKGNFDRIILSYSVSMIPDWIGAIEEAVSHLAPDGELHLVDFGDQRGFPQFFRRALRTWLAKFHVTPRTDLEITLKRVAEKIGGTVAHKHLFRRYAQHGIITRL